ncbi:GNAT family acetyltransferase [Enterococcus faecium EnGen0372]|uniref:GNAT family N-acetyltransferase n=1 Tax=Enterococcus faecium TaxID=1352 RepID=UPI00032F3935|nr:GNAT family N-acetyltransferase [Enterococcus faecium]EOG04308.1 GNAT family acetyltransferase [Enterococcus faecium EnGen0171]EOK13237.1 GNAT family acetyltransferase [Enterococcus faecium EnGen0372]EOM40129.1 GNAT family acetyltransferase [Enterococcus faecium EnGen0172]MDT2317111.1 GNAT family N-acetyltransferase [Enterococcus faecium]RBS33815.1 GNAT family acetyltransferase [Enterococcus faecium]
MIEELNKKDLPWSLLLDADPDKEKVQVYVSRGSGWIWKEKEKTIGVLIYVAREKEYEIVNVAVAPTYQGKGIGGKLLETAFQKLSELASSQTRIIIRTGTTSSAALHLYQKMGYVEIGRVKDYFIHHYSEPIFENGDQLRDQVILAIHLSKNSFN